MDNFFCSHRCTSHVRLGQGRVRVRSTGASRFYCNLLGLGLLSCPSIYAFAPISCDFVLSYLSHFLFCPKFQQPTIDDSRSRGWNLSLPNPTPKRRAVNL